MDEDIETPATELPKETPPHVEPPHHEGVSKEVFDSLAAKVEGLEAMVNGLVPKEQDSTPGKRPWTHRGRI